MPANTTPIYVKQPDISWATVITTANTAMNGTGTVLTVVTAPADGMFVNRLAVRALGTNVATVLRVFLNNGSDQTVAANNALLADITLSATTASNTTALNPVDVPLNIALPAGYKLNITIGTTVASGYLVTAIGGDY